MSVISATQIPRTTGKFEFVVLATLRAAQLMRGCVPKIAPPAESSRRAVRCAAAFPRIPPAMDGRDLLACATTGSGKTIAFLLPILHRLSDERRGVTRALVGAINAIRQTGVAILLVEQNMEIARAVGERCCMLAAGHLAWQGTMQEAIQRNEAARVYFGEH